MGEVEKHTQMKHRLLGNYLKICTSRVKSQRSHDFVVVDLYANDGVAYWPDGDEMWEGSAQIIAKWVSTAGERAYCILNERDKTLIEKLKENTKQYQSVIKEILTEDANVIHKYILKKYIPLDAHSIFLLDPYNHSELKFSTIKTIAEHCKEDIYRGESFIRRPELIINLPTFTIIKSKTQNPQLITDFLGTDELIQELEKAEKENASQPETILNVFKKQLKRYYPEDGIIPIEIRTLEANAPIYYLIFTATHPLAKTIQRTFEDWVKKTLKEFRREGFALKLIAEAKRKHLTSLDKWNN
ncbi:MAG: three-Cys-motif partner protein TcmP [Candidatus Thermoplasmatota archaeon]